MNPLKIVLISVGTRGDMEPFLALGALLQGRGHKVTCAFPEQFRPLAEESELPFATLGSKYIELLHSREGKAAMGGASGWKKFAGTLKLAMKQSDANKELIFKQQHIVDSIKPDRVLYNGKAVYPMIWGVKNKGKAVFISPVPYMHYVKGHTHVAFNSNFGTFFNRLSFSLAHFGLIQTIRISEKWLKIKDKSNRKQLKDLLRYGKSIYTISPSLFECPGEWDTDLQVLGYQESDYKHEWLPDNQLTQFINSHQKIVFITFGSMINPDPGGITRILLDIMERNQIPAIINTASGGLVKPSGFHSGLFYFVSDIPYHWILPKMYGVIHHGGSGTTHLALRYGCASLILPHIIDQFVWNKIAAEKGAGPRGIKIGKISKKNLEPKILDFYQNTKYKQMAEQISKQMKEEDFREQVVSTITGELLPHI